MQGKDFVTIIEAIGSICSLLAPIAQIVAKIVTDDSYNPKHFKKK